MTSAGRSTNEREQGWRVRAVRELLAVVERDGVAMARHLERARRLGDPRLHVLALAARRLLPLEAPVRRSRLAGEATNDSPAGAALGRLVAADRAALWPFGARGAGAAAAREHLASALCRLTRKRRAAHRQSGAPPVDSKVLSYWFSSRRRRRGPRRP